MRRTLIKAAFEHSPDAGFRILFADVEGVVCPEGMREGAENIEGRQLGVIICPGGLKYPIAYGEDSLAFLCYYGQNPAPQPIEIPWHALRMVLCQDQGLAMQFAGIRTSAGEN